MSPEQEGPDHRGPDPRGLDPPGLARLVDDPAALDHAIAELAAARRDLLIASETAREGLRRAARFAADLDDGRALDALRVRPPLRLTYPRWGWRRAIRFAVERRMLSRGHLVGYRRLLLRRLRAALEGTELVMQGMVFLGRDLELTAPRGRGRLVLGPWCWIGDGNRLRAHEGRLALGAKVVLGQGNAISAYLDVEIGDACLIADAVYVCDFDHRFDRLDVPIKDQGIVTAPVRIGRDVWIGEKATVLRGVDVGAGSVIGSQTLVDRDVPPFSIAVGTPVRVVRSRLPAGMDPEEALALTAAGRPIPGDPLEGPGEG